MIFLSFSLILTRWKSTQQLMDDLAMHIGQPEITSSVPIGESFMVHAEQVQDGGLQVMNIHFVIPQVVSEFITAAMDDTTLDAGSCKPRAVHTGMVTSAIGARRGDEWAAAKLCGKDDQGIIEHSPRFQVLQ